MKSVQESLSLLGYEAKDRVTGYIGVIDSIAFDLYGCIQVSLRPHMKKDGTLPDGRWFDEPRLLVISTKPVMNQPAFCAKPISEDNKDKGPAEKAPTR